jgi:hypothetical protein
MSARAVNLSHADREALLREFAYLVRDTINGPALVNTEQLERCGRAFDGVSRDGFSDEFRDEFRYAYFLPKLLEELHDLMVGVFKQAADGGDMPESLWVTTAPVSPPFRFVTAAPPADAEAVAP